MAGHTVSSQHTFHEFAASLHQQAEPLSLVQHLLSGLQRFIPTDYNSWKEISFEDSPRVIGVFAPHNTQAASLLPTFQRHVGEHPVCTHWRQSKLHAGALSWSDVTSRADMERLPIFGEFYRPLGIHHQLMVALESRPSHLIYLALNRGRAPYTDQDRQLLGSLQPHASQALRHLRELHRLRSTLASFETLVDSLNQGILCLSPQNWISWASSRARSYLQTYFGSAPNSSHLPNPLLAWVLKQTTSGGMNRPLSKSLSIRNRTGRLEIRLLIEKKEHYLFFENIPIQPAFDELTQLGLTEREAQVLGWVAQGKSNDDTAMILKMGPQTVKKHLERIYSALGVANRTEAARKAHDVLHRAHEA